NLACKLISILTIWCQNTISQARHSYSNYTPHITRPFICIYISKYMTTLQTNSDGQNSTRHIVIRVIKAQLKFKNVMGSNYHKAQ
ncbi:hypothetical protein Gotur_031734, partial [Gossypium turneri]